jgi:plasmid stabilization system protein ParE
MTSLVQDHEGPRQTQANAAFLSEKLRPESEGSAIGRRCCRTAESIRRASEGNLHTIARRADPGRNSAKMIGGRIQLRWRAGVRAELPFECSEQ